VWSEYIIVAKLADESFQDFVYAAPGDKLEGPRKDEQPTGRGSIGFVERVSKIAVLDRTHRVVAPFFE
jgi:hypothetical protein